MRTTVQVIRKDGQIEHVQVDAEISGGWLRFKTDRAFKPEDGDEWTLYLPTLPTPTRGAAMPYSLAEGASSRPPMFHAVLAEGETDAQ